MNVDEKQIYVNDFINRSFRDVADQDYLAARSLYRLDLKLQFLWASQQSVEKYLKAILLYNRRSTKRMGHKLGEALESLKDIRDIHFLIPEDVVEFIEYLDREGSNRYFEFPTFMLGDELLRLDRAVWHLRRYCQWLRGTSHENQEQHLAYQIQIINQWDQKKSHKFYIVGGFLEKILKKTRSSLREILVWKNFYYGAQKKRIIQKYTFNSGSGNPTHYLEPEIFAELKHLVRFSKEVCLYFEKGLIDNQLPRY